MALKDPHDALRSLLKGEVDMGRLAKLVLKQFGGYEGLAQALHDNYEAEQLEDGSRTRVQILDNVIRLLERQSDRVPPDSTKTLEELEAEALRMAEEIAQDRLQLMQQNSDN